MFGLFLVAIAMFSSEIGTSIGKKEVHDQKESLFTMGFLNMFWGALFLFLLAFFVPKDFFAPGLPGGFVFSLASLPTFISRVILEVAQVHVTLIAITRADRSTFSFLRIITIPLLLIIDIALGYQINFYQIIGIGFILVSFIFLFINHGIRKKGIWFVLFTAINAAVTISLFKYNITNFNSVEAEQGIMLLILLVYLFFMARFVAKENPIQFLKQPIFLLQSASKGIGVIIMSFAYLFAAASIITTAKRSFAILWSILSGNLYFHEKRFFIKFISYLLIIVGLVFLVL